MEPALVEECTLLKLVPALEKVAKALKSDTGHHDLFVALLTVIMGEVGFRLEVNSARLDNGDSETLDPNKWKSTLTRNYELRFKHHNEMLDCKIVGAPVGDVIVINLCSLKFSDDVARTRSAAFQTLKYVNPYSSDLAGRFRNLKELSHRFKDSLTTPMKGEILTKAGITNASLEGLPMELKLRILELLGIPAICRMAQTSREFAELSKEFVSSPVKWLEMPDSPRRIQNSRMPKVLTSFKRRYYRQPQSRKRENAHEGSTIPLWLQSVLRARGWSTYVRAAAVWKVRKNAKNNLSTLRK